MFTFFSLALALAPPVYSAPPNVVLIMTDDQGFGDFGFLGADVLRTPRLDRLAAESVRVDPFYVCPVCAPTRASLMTGRYHYRTGVTDTWVGRAMMAPDEVTIAELLRDAGYATGLFGKWHLGDCLPMRPQDQGFERVLVHRGGGIGQPSDPVGAERKYTDPTLVDDGELRAFDGYCTDIYFEHARAFIDRARRDQRPFFCVITTNAPHGPFHDVPPARLADLLERTEDERAARIFAMIENIDDNVGRLIDHLDDERLSESTLVLFLNDNGPNGPGRSGPFRGQKTGVHEGGVRTPLLARWPGRFPAGHVVERFGAHIDLLPTILEACDVDQPNDLRIDGRSLLPLLEAREVAWPDRSLVIQTHRGDRPLPLRHFFLRDRRFKLVHPTGFGGEGFEGEPRFELYDLLDDPTERTDLAADHPDIVSRMRATYDAWFKDVTANRDYAPLPILVGDPRENPTTLTQQDWRTVAGGWGKNASGDWYVDVAEAATFDLSIRFPARDVPLVVTVDIGAVTRTLSVDVGAEECSIVAFPVEAGPTRVSIRLRAEGLEVGPHQVDLLRTSP